MTQPPAPDPGPWLLLLVVLAVLIVCALLLGTGALWCGHPC